ncbi:CLUMA_CG007927, isoform A [Clunio marinus]|uniref:CLUMA_CG007927, isoform A n=1 Tax=Clunio marinus TaxID=568069 RepID=A0A1J1I498_9DIPT|nr:CLUMA_CG007927, isoform A [Clunio marinus]
MAPKLPINISTFSKSQIREWINSFEVILTDCDGVLWLYNNILKNSNVVINRLLEMGKKVYFITNNSTKTRDELVEKAKTMNFNVGMEGMISTAYLAAQYLKQQNFNKKVYIVGSSGISKELDLVGLKHVGVGPDVMNGTIVSLVKEQFKPDPEIGAVIVGFDENFSFPKMMKAASYLNNPSTIFVATNTDERFPMPNFVVPGTGAIVKAIETCAERKAVVMGKPENWLCDIFFKEEIKRDSRKFLMIGDRLNTDILFGKKNNFQTLLVETGVHKIDKVQDIINQINNGDTDLDLANQVPDFYISSLGDLFNNYD